MNQFFTLAADPAATGGESNPMSWVMIIAMYAVVIGGMYFILIRPQSKKKKKEEKMRKNVQIGDEITTIGGVCGRVVGMKDESDSIIIETGTDRSKMRIKRWAVGSVDTVHDDVEG